MKVCKVIFATAMILFYGWIGLSYLDIVADNNTPNPVHSDYNFFSIICEVGD